MKKWLFLLLAAALLLPTVTACNASGDTSKMKEFFDQTQYTLYQNVFANQTGDNYLGMKMTISGTMGTLEDSSDGITRYYVWGYLDQTKCCDWQWEFVLPEGTAAPKNGTAVTMAGFFTKDTDALDGYWFTDVKLTVDQEYTGDPAAEYDLTCLSATLARVQIWFMERYGGQYNGKTVKVYGRVYNGDSLQHPYYDGVWQMKLQNAKLPATGTPVTVTGSWTYENDASYWLDATSVG